MASSTLLDIKRKVRRLTGSASTSQLSEDELEHYINTFYEQDFPASLKTWDNWVDYTFYTVENEDQYTFDTTTYTNVRPPCYVQGYPAQYLQSQAGLYAIFPNTPTQSVGPAGDGTAGPYAFLIEGAPLLKRQVTISVIDSAGITQTAYDVPSDSQNLVGILYSAITNQPLANSTVNYATGAVSITFPNTVDSTEIIQVAVKQIQLSRPWMVNLYNNTFTVRPVPDKAYSVTVQAYKSPIQLLEDEQSPAMKDTWQYVALGAAIKVMQDRQDSDAIASIMPFFKEQEALVLYRTAVQMAPMSTPTIYDGYGQQWGGWNNRSGWGF